MKIILLISFLLLFHHFIGFSQNDSLEKLYSNSVLLTSLNKRASQLKQSQSNIICFAWFSRLLEFEFGVIVWKTNSELKAIKLCYENGAIRECKVKKRSIERIRESSLFDNECDSVNFCTLLNGDNRADISHDFVMYLERYVKNDKKNQEQKIYFTYSTYLGSQSNCVKKIKNLMGFLE